MQLGLELNRSKKDRAVSYIAAMPATTANLSKLPDCMTCMHRSRCLAGGLESKEIEHLNSIVKHSHRLSRGEYLYRMWDPFKSIFTVVSGCVKSYTLDESGCEQISRFYLPGEVLAIDGIGSDRYPSSAQALETTFVCELPYHFVENRGTQLSQLQRELIRHVADALRNEQRHANVLGKKSAEQRVALFLLDLLQRFNARNYTSNEFILSMSRYDIGNYLSLAMETVSRTFSRLQDLGVITANRKRITIHDMDQLRRLTVETESCDEDGALGFLGCGPRSH